MTMQLTYLGSLQKLANEAQEQIDQLMPHMGEKGRLGEEIIRNILSDLLPKRFSIGTGIIVSSDGQVSNQVDIVIYDHLYNAPMISNFSTCVFPIECVYAFIEVKTTLTLGELRKSFASIRKIRRMGKNKSYLVQVWEKQSDGSNMLKAMPITMTTAPRGYIIGFKRRGISNTFDGFKKKIAVLCDERNTFIHGIGLLDEDWFVRRKRGPKTAVIFGNDENALANFYKAILIGQSNYIVHPANTSAYLPD